MGLPQFTLHLPTTRTTRKIHKCLQVPHEVVLGSVREGMPILSHTVSGWAFHLRTPMGLALVLSLSTNSNANVPSCVRTYGAMGARSFTDSPRAIHEVVRMFIHPPWGVEKAGLGRAHPCRKTRKGYPSSRSNWAAQWEKLPYTLLNTKTPPSDEEVSCKSLEAGEQYLSALAPLSWTHIPGHLLWTGVTSWSVGLAQHLLWSHGAGVRLDPECLSTVNILQGLLFDTPVRKVIYISERNPNSLLEKKLTASQCSTLKEVHYE